MLGTFAVACVIFSFSVTVRVDRASDSSSFASPVDGARASSAIASAVASSRVSVLAIRVHTNDDASEHDIDVARVELSLHRASPPPSSRRRASPLVAPRAFSRASPTVFLVTDHDSSRHPLDQSHHGTSTVSNHITGHPPCPITSRARTTSRVSTNRIASRAIAETPARDDADERAGAGADFSARRATTASADARAPTTKRRGNARARGEEDARETRAPVEGTSARGLDDERRGRGAIRFRFR